MEKEKDLEAAKGKFALTIEMDAMKKIQAEVYKHRIRVKEYFHDFDKLRKGSVSEAAVSEILLRNI